VKEALIALKGKSISIPLIKQYLQSVKSPYAIMCPASISKILKFELNFKYRKPHVTYLNSEKDKSIRERKWFTEVF